MGLSMLKRLARGGAAGLFAALVACAHQAGSVPATRDAPLAAGTPGWRITQVLPNVAVGGLWAGGARDAWLAGDACADLATCGVSDTSNGTVVVRHWDGTSWRAVKPPRAYINTPLDQGAGPVAATSASNVWIAAYRGTESVDYTDMLHWTGTGWAAPVRLPTAIQAAIAPSATQLWAFGDATKPGQAGFVAHFTGTTWIRAPFPLAGTAAAALSPSDVWAGGNTSTGQPGIEHWDGRTWQATPLPGLELGTSPFFGLTVAGIAAVKPDDVWADISDLGSADSNRQGAFLLHWNGKAWTRVVFPYSGLAFSPVTTDGHAGLWLVLAASDKELWFCHFSAGHWTRTPVPSRPGEQPGAQNLAWIPGTHSQWATGGVSSASDGTAILKYGT
jgi:hypothetical protein